MEGGEALESEIKKLIVEALVLEDVDPQQIETDAEVFCEGLGLDLIDALEAGYGVTVEDDPEGNGRIPPSLADFVHTQGREPGGRQGLR